MTTTTTTSPTTRSTVFVGVVGLLAAMATQLNWAASYTPAWQNEPVMSLLLGRLGIAAIAGPTVTLVGRWLLRKAAFASAVTEDAKRRYARLDHWTFAPLLLALVGAFGIKTGAALSATVVALFVCAQLGLLLSPPRPAEAPSLRPMLTLSALFMVSGFAALIYQVSWQRALFTAFGVNIESITVVVSLFMFGLGVGAMVGGYLSARFPDRLAQLFLAAEVAIGVFGLASLALIAAVSWVAVNGSLPVITLAIYALLALPTLCMGATLPILVAHVHTWYGHIGKAVGLLYFVNTIGSAIACWITTDVLFIIGGLQSSVAFAAACNLVVGVSVYMFMVRGGSEEVAA